MGLRDGKPPSRIISSQVFRGLPLPLCTTLSLHFLTQLFFVHSSPPMSYYNLPTLPYPTVFVHSSPPMSYYNLPTLPYPTVFVHSSSPMSYYNRSTHLYPTVLCPFFQHD